MKKSVTPLRLLCVAAFALVLSACQTMEPPKAAAVPVKPKIEDLLARASEAQAAGKTEQALALWKETAQNYPEDKQPWVRIAQTRYDAGQYGEAIMGAQEILVRDPSDQLANSIIAISGLRLSTRALGDLSRQNNLSGSIRTESQDLAKLLRESLGETVLVPPAPKAAAAPAKSGGRKTKTTASNPSADPFGALK